MQDLIIKGDLNKAGKVLIMVHGRGASAEDILSLSEHLSLNDFTLIAPQAKDHTWYPYSFISPQIQNEPHLTNSLNVLAEIVKMAEAANISSENIYFLGFSQGACLSLEYATRNAKKWGGVAAFTGGLIGETLQTNLYTGDFTGTRIYIGTSDPDPHVPVSRVKETENILRNMNAAVVVEIFKNMGHTINQQELQQAEKIFNS